MRLFGSVVGFGEGFGDDERGHVDFVLEEEGDLSFDIAAFALSVEYLKKFPAPLELLG